MCMRCERERERYRERERERRKWRHLSSAEIGDEICTFPCQNFAPLFRTALVNNAEFTLSVAKYVALFETVRILRLFCQWPDMDRSTKSNDRISGGTILLLIEKMNQINTKTIENRKRDCAWGCAGGDKHHLRKSADRKAQIRKAFVELTGLICAFRSADFLRWCLFPERNLTHNLFFYFQ